MSHSQENPTPFIGDSEPLRQLRVQSSDDGVPGENVDRPEVGGDTLPESEDVKLEIDGDFLDPRKTAETALSGQEEQHETLSDLEKNEFGIKLEVLWSAWSNLSEEERSTFVDAHPQLSSSESGNDPVESYITDQLRQLEAAEMSGGNNAWETQVHESIQRLQSLIDDLNKLKPQEEKDDTPSFQEVSDAANKEKYWVTERGDPRVRPTLGELANIKKMNGEETEGSFDQQQMHRSSDTSSESTPPSVDLSVPEQRIETSSESVDESVSEQQTESPEREQVTREEITPVVLEAAQRVARAQAQKEKITGKNKTNPESRQLLDELDTEIEQARQRLFKNANSEADWAVAYLFFEPGSEEIEHAYAMGDIEYKYLKDLHLSLLNEAKNAAEQFEASERGVATKAEKDKSKVTAGDSRVKKEKSAVESVTQEDITPAVLKAAQTVARIQVQEKEMNRNSKNGAGNVRLPEELVAERERARKELLENADSEADWALAYFFTERASEERKRAWEQSGDIEYENIQELYHSLLSEAAASLQQADAEQQDRQEVEQEQSSVGADIESSQQLEQHPELIKLTPETLHRVGKFFTTAQEIVKQIISEIPDKEASDEKGLLWNIELYQDQVKGDKTLKRGALIRYRNMFAQFVNLYRDILWDGEKNRDTRRKIKQAIRDVENVLGFENDTE